MIRPTWGSMAPRLYGAVPGRRWQRTRTPGREGPPMMICKAACAVGWALQAGQRGR